jgi:putative ABC transport system permease protein
MDGALSDAVSSARLTTTVLALFAAIALAMAAVGLFGVIAYGVEQRTREIGVRVALGADRGDLLRLMAGDGLRLTAWGIGVGTAASAAASRAMRSVLFEVSPADPLTYVAVVALFAGVAAVACVLPARRALRVDPLVALRAE